MRPHRVLFLGATNACRTQMAEAILRARSGGGCDVVSAGITPGVVSPLAALVMAEMGLSLADQRAKSALEFLGKQTFGTTIIIGAASEPGRPTMFFGSLAVVHWDIASAAALTAVDDPVSAHRVIRDEIARRIDGFCAGITPATESRPASGRLPDRTPSPSRPMMQAH